MDRTPIECERWVRLYTSFLADRRRFHSAMEAFSDALGRAYLQRLHTRELLQEMERRARASAARLLPVVLVGYQLVSMVG